MDDSLAPVRQDILRLAALHGARNVRVFGSFSRGQARPDSDLDLLVDMEAGRTLLDRIALLQDLEDLLELRTELDRILAELPPPL